jgi:mycothiol synthase
MTRAMFEERAAEPWFDPEGLLITELDGRVAGFCWTKLFAEESPVLGEIHVICVHPDFAGRRLGRALVLAGLDHLAGRGATVGMLFVEADNTAALELYHKLDFAIVRTDRAFATTVRASS